MSVLLAGTLVSALCIGLRSTFGLYLGPMTDAYGWSRESFALAIAIQNLVWGVSAPFTGGLADRFGTGRVVALGGGIYAVGLWGMAAATTPTALTLSAGLVVGLGTSATGFGVILGAVGRAAPPERRSLYLGIASAGGSIGQFVLVALSQGLISRMGWQHTLEAVAVVALLMAPLSWALAGRAEPREAKVSSSPVKAFCEAAGEGRYWLLFCGFFVCGFHVTFIATHLPAFLTDHEIAPSVAATALALIGLFNIAGSSTFGYLGGRFSKRKTLCALYLARAVVITGLLALPLSSTTVLAFAAAMGFLWLGTVPLTSGLVAQIYGARYMSTLFSVIFLGHQIGAFVGVWAGGRVYDATGSYTPVWLAAIALGMISAALHWPIDERASVAPPGLEATGRG